MDEITVTRLINGPEAFTPDNEFCLGESEVRGFFVAAGFCAHGLAGAGGIGQGDGRVDPRGRAGDGRVGDGHPPLRRRTTARPATRSSAPGRSTRPTTTSATPATSARPGGRCGPRAPTRGTPSTAPRSARSPAGSGSTGTSRNAAGGRRVAAPARLGGDALVAGDRRRAPRHARARRAVRRVLVRQARDRRAGRGRLPGTAVRQPRGARGRRDHLHADAQPPRRDRVRLHRHARRGGAVLDRHRHRVRQPRPQLDPPPRAGGRQRALRRRHRALGVLRAVGPARAGDPRAADRRPARLPLHAHARARRSATCPCARCASRSSASSAGSCTARPSTAPGCGGRCGRPGASTGCVAGGYRAIDSLRLEKGYRVWAADITPDETPHEAGLGFCVKEAAASSGAEALGVGSARGPASRAGACAAWCSRTRARWRSATSRCASSGEVVGRVTSGGYGYTVERSIAYAYLPAEVEVGRGGRGGHLRRVGRRARWRASRCSTRAASGSGSLASVSAFVTAGAGFLLCGAVVRPDVRRPGRGPRPEPGCPEGVLASIAAYYGRVTTAARPMNRLIAAVMVGHARRHRRRDRRRGRAGLGALGLARRSPRPRSCSPARAPCQRGATRRARRHDR